MTADQLIEKGNVFAVVTADDGEKTTETHLDVAVNSASLTALHSATPGTEVPVTFETEFEEESKTLILGVTIGVGEISVTSATSAYLQQGNQGNMSETSLKELVDLSVTAETEDYSIAIDSLEKVNALTTAGSSTTVTFTVTDDQVPDLTATCSSKIYLYDSPTISGNDVVLEESELSALTVASLKAKTNYSASAFTESRQFTVYLAPENMTDIDQEETVLAEVKKLTGTATYTMNLVVDDTINTASTPITVRIKQENEPTIEITGTQGENNWYTEAVTATITSNLTNGGTAYYKTDSIEWAEYTDSIPLEYGETGTVSAKNQGTDWQSEVISVTVHVDTQVPAPPTITLREAESTSELLIFDLTQGEIGESGLKEIQLPTDGGKTWLVSDMVTVTGNLAISGKVINRAGVESEIATFVVDTFQSATPAPDPEPEAEEEEEELAPEGNTGGGSSGGSSSRGGRAPARSGGDLQLGSGGSGDLLPA